ncbi:hypothetical protein QUA83_29745 [Microcoleus sp. K1-B1]
MVNPLESIQTKQCDRYFYYANVTELYQIRAIAYNKGVGAIRLAET